MGILAPLALLLGLLAIPIIIFYMLRLRRQEITISSNLLWRQVVQDRQANAPWQRLRRNLLLYLQLLVLALLVLSIARPFLLTDAAAAGNLIVVIDGSASMQASDGAATGQVETRFEAARREASTLASSLSSNERMTVILAGTSPQTVIAASSSRAAVSAAIAALEPGNGGADMGSALTLAAAAASQLDDPTIVVIGDGALGNTALPDVPANVRFVPIGNSSRNQGITAMALRDASAGPQLFLNLANYNDAAANLLLAVEVDGKLWDSRQLTLEPRAESSLTLPDLPLTTAAVTATLRTDDLLAADNTAWAIRSAPPAANTLLVSSGNSFMEKALNLLPQVKLFKVEPAAYAPSNDYATTVFDGYVPPSLPGGNFLLINPPNSPLVPISGTIEYPQIGQVEVNDPLLRYVDWRQVHISRAQKAITPTWARPLVQTTAGDPLLMVGEIDGHRAAVITFDLHQSDLPLLVTFPILVVNLMSWLQPAGTIEVPPRLDAGAVLAIHPRPEADRVVITGPSSGERTELDAGTGTVPFAGTGSLGIYSVQQTAAGNPLGAPEMFAVNLFSRQESDITPRTTINVAGRPAVSGEKSAERPVEIWPILLAISALLLLLEWWIYHRGRAGGSLQSMLRNLRKNFKLGRSTTS